LNIQINIGGVTKFTTVDFPDRFACVLFLQGCPWRCSFCHNGHLQKFSCDENPNIPWSHVNAFLTARKGKLDGVVFSGGEPLLQPNLREAMEAVKNMGYEVALHTGGYSPERLEKVLPLCDWVGMDFKSVLKKYSDTTRANVKMQNIEKSLDMLLKSGKEFEIRTTLDPRIITKEELLKIADYLSEKGVKTYAIQEYRPLVDGGEGEPSMSAITSFFTDKELLEKLKSKFDNFIARR
jgi:pyruvate formate lyase activating enzyme